MKTLGIIPARYGSTRFPGKPLALIGGVTMIERVYNQACKAKLDRVVVATDHQGIADAVVQFGGEVVLTHPDAPSGTDRCREALGKLKVSPDVVVNIQGDEPFIEPSLIDTLIGMFDRDEMDIATIVSPSLSQNELENPNRVKAIVTPQGKALYFSRQPIPYLQGKSLSQWNAFYTYYIHLGVYAYRADVLRAIGALQPSPLEQAESLEQLRWLENGLSIFASVAKERTDSVDTPEDLAVIEKKYFL